MSSLSKFKKLTDTRLKDAVALARDSVKTDPKKGVRKTATFLGTTKAAEGDGGTGLDMGLYAPDEAELAVINTYTRSPKTADQVAVLPTLSANDLLDRDFEKFTTQTVKDFAALPGELGPNGKAFMVGHDYTKLPIGRIFSTDTAKIGDSTFLTNKVYVPNTAQYKDYLENVDFGIDWAVSVGVMLNAIMCSVGLEDKSVEEHNMTGLGFCEKGHIKGYSYDTSSDEEDEWGWPEPVQDSAKGAELCIGLMSGAKDFFELSQVFLGAQIGAKLEEKHPGLAGVMKAAGVKGIPIIGLSAKEAEDIPMPVHIEQVDKAVAAGADIGDDGTTRWVDENKLVWVLEPGASEADCLGKEADTQEVNEDGEGSQQGHGSAEALGVDSEVEPEAGSGRLHDSGDGDAEGTAADSDRQEGDVAPTTPGSASSELSPTLADVVGKLISFKAPVELIESVKTSTDGSVEDWALKVAVARLLDAQTTIAQMAPRAAMGDKHLSAAKAAAIDWYVRANATGKQPEKAVNVAGFQKLLDAAGDDLEVIEMLTEQQKGIAQRLFPAVVRRSVVASDARPDVTREVEDAGEPRQQSSRDKRVVGKLHQ